MSKQRTMRLTAVHIVVGCLVIAVVAAAAGAMASRVLGSSSSSQSSCNTVQVAHDALPSVVTIYATGPSSSGSGSGAIIRADGVILTNNHVVAEAIPSGSLAVLFNDGQRVPASVVGTDPVSDLAVLKVDRTGLPIMKFGIGDRLAVGQPVVALGAPLGLSGSVTSGIISALGRNVPAPRSDGGTTVLVDAIQTDAPINPGNSGGPLVTCNGALVGVNTAISTVPDSNGQAVGGSVGIGFAVPSSTAQRVSGELLTNGKVTHPWVGAQVAEISDAMASRFGTSAGLFVQNVTGGGPADQAGLRVGDIITTLGGSPANSVSLAYFFASAKVGDEVHVQVQRGSQHYETTVKLGEQP